MAKAYNQQLVIDKHGCLTIRAPRSGLVRFKVLSLGISSAVALFQRQMEDLLGEDLIAAGVRVCLDDILIFSKTLDDHLVLLDKVLAKLAEAGLKVCKDKCAFAVNSTEFLGYKISPEGIAVSEDRIQALLEPPKFRRFLIEMDFLIRTDHRPLVGLFKKPLLSIEDEDLRDLVSQMSEYSFTVEYVPGPSKELFG
jgi:hypothetical protein